jgi:hypothetical protein
MIITELYDGQGLGNQLWVYAAARSIAEQLNVPFVLLGAERFKGKEFLNIDSDVGISALEAINIAKNSHFKSFNEALFYDGDLDYISSGFDSRVLSLSGTNKLNGLYQSEKYFFGNLERPNKYFILDDAWKAKNTVPDDTCIINLRGGEYKRHKSFILPESYWKKALENMTNIANVRKFLVVTDDARYARVMFPGFDVLEGGIGDCYASLYNAKYLILSNSSFAYFPVKTGGNSRIVIAPKYWARYANTMQRWASTANLYESWLWQASDGNLSTFEECLPECEATEAEYEIKYFVRTTLEQFQKPGIRQFVPAAIRNKGKRALSLFFPRHFG